MDFLKRTKGGPFGSAGGRILPLKSAPDTKYPIEERGMKEFIRDTCPMSDQISSKRFSDLNNYLTSLQMN